MTPRWDTAAAGVPRYLPTFAGTSQLRRVRSGLIASQWPPPSLVFQSLFAAK
jgi:hypothetical protein